MLSPPLTTCPSVRVQAASEVPLSLVVAAACALMRTDKRTKSALGKAGVVGVVGADSEVMPTSCPLTPALAEDCRSKGLQTLYIGCHQRVQGPIDDQGKWEELTLVRVVRVVDLLREVLSPMAPADSEPEQEEEELEGQPEHPEGHKERRPEASKRASGTGEKKKPKVSVYTLGEDEVEVRVLLDFGPTHTSCLGRAIY